MPSVEWVIRLSGPKIHDPQPSRKPSRTSPFFYSRYVSAKLRELRALAEGWDGEAARPPTQEAVYRMYRLLTRLGDGRTVFPFIVPDGTGGVVAEWRAAGKRIEIEVDGDGQAACCATDGAGEISLDKDLGEHVDEQDIGRLAALLAELSTEVREKNPSWRRLFR